MNLFEYYESFEFPCFVKHEIDVRIQKKERDTILIDYTKDPDIVMIIIENKNISLNFLTDAQKLIFVMRDRFSNKLAKKYKPAFFVVGGVAV